MKGLIKVGYSCNENCTFCHTRDVRHIDGSAAEVSAKIKRAKELGYSMVVLSGGEATIRPELFDWAAQVVELDMDLGLVTNGQMLAYPEFLDRLLAHRLRYVYMSLHGGDAKIHNRLVRSHGFDNALQALKNLQGKGLELTINTVITQQNLEHLKGVVDLILDFPEVRLKFSMVEPKGGGNRLFRQLTPSVSEVGRRVLEALKYGVEKAGPNGPRFAHDGVPFCFLPGFEHCYDDLKTHRYATMTDIGEPDFHPVDERAKVHPPPCQSCALRGPCPGLYKGYHSVFGHEELRPVTNRPRSNSFTWTFETLVGSDVPEDRCPLWAIGTTPFDRGRTLFVRNGRRVARYRSETRDFSDEEIEHIKHGMGQVYFDRSRKPAPDNFATDLAQLRLTELCHTCPQLPRCTGMYEPVFEDVFSRDDQRVRDLLAQLSGAVLDVGCGEGPYEDLLAPLSKSGQIHYSGLEPEPRRVAQLRARWPWARVLQGSAEELELALASEEGGAELLFDHILILRSWNHLHDPKLALARLLARLRPGGSLVVVDNVAFGLARTRLQTNQAHHSDAAFEHYRNDGAQEAQEHLSAFPVLRLVEQMDVGPSTSNQWLLRYVKDGGEGEGVEQG